MLLIKCSIHILSSLCCTVICAPSIVINKHCVQLYSMNIHSRSDALCCCSNCSLVRLSLRMGRSEVVLRRMNRPYTVSCRPAFRIACSILNRLSVVMWSLMNELTRNSIGVSSSFTDRNASVGFKIRCGSLTMSKTGVLTPTFAHKVSLNLAVSTIFLLSLGSAALLLELFLSFLPVARRIDYFCKRLCPCFVQYSLYGPLFPHLAFACGTAAVTQTVAACQHDI